MICLSDDDEYLNSENDPQTVEVIQDDDLAEIESVEIIEEQIIGMGAKVIKTHKSDEIPAGFLFKKKKK